MKSMLQKKLLLFEIPMPVGMTGFEHASILVLILYQFKSIPIEQSQVAQLQMGDDQQHMNDKVIEGPERAAGPLAGCRWQCRIGCSVAVVHAHETGDGQGQDKLRG